MKFIGIFTLGALTLIGGTLYSGFATTVLWGWFIIPLFGLNPINLAQAIGLKLVISWFCHRIPSMNELNKEKRSASEKLTENIIRAIMLPSLVLGFGWIIQKFMA